MDPSRPPDDAELFDFLDEYHRDLDAGREVSLASYLKRFPGHEEGVAREFVRLRGAPQPTPEAPRSKDDSRIGPYQLLRELGSGGQGAVWLAEDTRIARQVALKFMPSSFAMLSSERRRRFQREAEVVSRLEHASICPVYEAQIDHDPPYIAMRLVEGETLAAAIARARIGERCADDVLPLPPRDPVELRRVLSFFERAARALHAAHEAGVVHRDFKPGNVMVSKSGEPVIVDFGQARDERADLSERTVSGEVLGTPAYMSPEQVAGAAHGLDRRTDVWSLGASLYEALTLVRPFHGDNVAALMHAVRTQPLPNPRGLSKAVDEDVAVVLETALEKDLPRRYQSALEFAEDLRRIREYEPIRARPAGPVLKLRRWAQRHPALAFAVLAISAGLIWSAYLMRRESAALREKSKALSERSEAQQREIQALQREANAIDSALGRYLAVRVNDVLAEDPAAALAIALKAVDLAPGYQARSAVFSALNECWLAATIQSVDGSRTRDLDISRDGRWIVGGLNDGKARVWDLRKGTEITSVDTASHSHVERVCFAPRGEFFVAGSENGTLTTFRPDTGERLGRTDHLQSAVAVLAALPDHLDFIALSRDGRGAILRGAELSIRATFEVAPESFNDITISSDGRFALLASAQQARPRPERCAYAVVLDLADGRELARLDCGGSMIAASAISPDSSMAATASVDGKVHLWRMPNGEPIGEPIEHDAPLSCVRFSLDGRHVFTGTDADERSCVRIWDINARTSRVLEGQHKSRIESIDVCEENGHVVACSRDTAISIWNAEGDLLNLLRERLRPVSVRWTRDGSRLVTFALATYSHVWWGEHRPDVYELRGHVAPIRSVEFSSDGARAWTLSTDGVARLWATPRNDEERAEHATGTELARFGGNGDEVVLGRFGRSDELLLMTRSGRVGWMEPRSDQLVDVSHIDGVPLDSDWVRTEDGGSLVVVTSDGTVFERTLHTRAAEFARIAEGATCARFVDGERVAVAGNDDRVRILRSGGELEREFTWASGAGGSGVVTLAVRADRRELAVACRDGRVRFFPLDETLSSREELKLFPVNTLAFDPQSQHLLAVGRRGHSAVRVFSLATNKAVRDEAFHTADLTSGSFDRSGRFVLTSSRDRSVYVREAATGEPFARRNDFEATVTCAAFSTDDGELRVISGCEDGRVFVWPVDPTRAALARKPRDLWPWEDDREARLAAPLPYR